MQSERAGHRKLEALRERSPLKNRRGKSESLCLTGEPGAALNASARKDRTVTISKSTQAGEFAATS